MIEVQATQMQKPPVRCPPPFLDDEAIRYRLPHFCATHTHSFVVEEL